jgi:hypothetical protein
VTIPQSIDVKTSHGRMNMKLTGSRILLTGATGGLG